MNQGRMPPSIPPGIASTQGALGIGTPIGMELPAQTVSGPQPIAAPREDTSFSLDPWHSAAYSLGQRQPRDERAQQAGAQASEPSDYLHADDQAMRHPQSSPPIHTHPDAPRVNFDYAQMPRPARQVPETFRKGHDLEQPMSPFGNGAQVGYSTPDMRPGYNDGPTRNIGQQGVANPGLSAWAGGRTCVFEISRKKNNLRFVLTHTESERFPDVDRPSC